MFLSICPSCHHRDEQVESGEFPRGAVTCTDCVAPYAPIHAADVRFALLENWATREGVEFDDDSPIEEADANRFEAFLADGSWFVKVLSREVMSGPEQFEFTCVDPRAADPEKFLLKAMFEDANEIRTRSKWVASTSVENDDTAYRLITTFIRPNAQQTDTYYLIKGF